MIDWTRIEELRSEIGDTEFDEVVDVFLEEVEEALEGLNETARDRAVTAHFLKGAGLNLGLIEFAALCRAAETDAGAMDTGELCASYRSARDMLLRRLRGTGRPTPQAG